MSANGRKPRSTATKRGPRDARPEDRYFSICAATKARGGSCTNRVQGKARTDFIIQNRLPVCKTHLAQDFFCIAGFCEATLDDGSLCNRLIAAQPGYNQLCEDHLDVMLPCHLLRLPTEIRLMVFDEVVPEGEIQSMPTYVWAPILGLLRVSRQISAEIANIIFRSRSRPCPIYVRADEIRYLNFSYKDTTSAYYKRSLQHVSSFDGQILHAFQHLRLVVECNWRYDRDDSELYALLEVFRRTVHGIRK